MKMRSVIVALFLVLCIIATVYCDNSNGEANKAKDKKTSSSSKETTDGKNLQSKLTESNAKNLVVSSNIIYH